MCPQQKRINQSLPVAAGSGPQGLQCTRSSYIPYGISKASTLQENMIIQHPLPCHESVSQAVPSTAGAAGITTQALHSPAADKDASHHGHWGSILCFITYIYLLFLTITYMYIYMPSLYHHPRKGDDQIWLFVNFIFKVSKAHLRVTSIIGKWEIVFHTVRWHSMTWTLTTWFEVEVTHAVTYHLSRLTLMALWLHTCPMKLDSII